MNKIITLPHSQKRSGCIFFVPDPEGEISGRPMANNRNLLALKAVYKEVVVVTYKPPRLKTQNRWRRILQNLQQIFSPCSSDAYYELLEEVEKHPDYHVFFTHSKFGVFVRNLKKKHPETFTSVFFHNVELMMTLLRSKTSKSIIEFPIILKYYISEKNICKHADRVLVLNSRDGNLLKKIFGCQQDKLAELPMSLVDRNTMFVEKTYDVRKWKILFVGTYAWFNIPGLKAFIQTVMTKDSDVAELYVVGFGLDKLGKELGPFHGVHYIGEVSQETLNEYYKNADIFVAPVTTGGGMKTKVAEAMMYGVPVVGTGEAFTGYDVDIAKMGFCSDDIPSYADFIRNVTPEQLKSMSDFSRQYYKQKYSLDTSIRILRKIYCNE